MEEQKDMTILGALSVYGKEKATEQESKHLKLDDVLEILKK